MWTAHRVHVRTNKQANGQTHPHTHRDRPTCIHACMHSPILRRTRPCRTTPDHTILCHTISKTIPCIHKHRCAYTHTYVHTHLHIYIHACKPTYMQAYIYICTKPYRHFLCRFVYQRIVLKVRVNGSYKTRRVTELKVKVSAKDPLQQA